jgi:catalase
MHSARPFLAVDAGCGAKPAVPVRVLARGARVLVIGLVAALACIQTAAAADDAPAADQRPLPVALVEALNKLSGGPHPGWRANHAKGVLVAGSFDPAPTAPSLSKAPHFLTRVPVLVRFSDTTGVPNIPDADPNASPHGMAIRFKLPSGSSTDIVSISVNSFPVATPQDFLALLTAISKSGPDAPKPTPVEQFLGSHPAAKRFVETPKPPPQSFATTAFYGVNAFKFTNAKGVSRYARYQILPLAGEHALSPAEAQKVGPDYLMEELPKRIAAGAVKYRLVAQVAEQGDVTNDATVSWPKTRKIIELGVITLNMTEADQVAEQKKLLYNPLLLPAGIEPSDDPILAARPPAYAISFTQRAQ